MWNKFKYLFLAILFSSCATSPPAEKESCLPEVRAAFDIGSGTTKMKVAKVNPCSEEVTEWLVSGARKVDYSESLGVDELFTEDVRAAGIKALLELKAEADPFQPKSWRAVATEAFRKAKNADSFLGEVKSELGFEAKIVSQVEEGRLGFQAAAPKGAKSLVWDIGGGSQQLSYLDENGSLKVFRGKMGSVVFKNLVVEKVKQQDFEKVKSPNPLGKKLGNAQRLAVEGTKELSADLQKWIRSHNPAVIGVGGVHYHSVRNQLGAKEDYSLAAVKLEARKRAFWNDEKIGGKYASTEVTNLILVGAFMERLGIKEVKVKNADLTDALLVLKDW